MSELINLDEVRHRKMARQAFVRWQRRIGFTPDQHTTLMELPDRALMNLAELDNTASLALYDLVLGVHNWGLGEAFHQLDPDRKMAALDAYLFLADQVRFELMRRLGWVQGLAGEGRTLLELALEHQQIQAQSARQVPELLPTYHGYRELERRLASEPAAVVRSLIPEALTVFRQRSIGSR